MLLASWLLTASAVLQQPSGERCAALLAGLRAKVEENYAGFQLEVRDARRGAYDVMFSRLTSDSRSASGDACYNLLDSFTGWFDDPHLFVFQSIRLDSAESAHRARQVRRTAITESKAREYFTQRARSLDRIEGIWYDGAGLRVAILPDSEVRGRFMAVVLTSDTASWPVGSVRASIVRAGRTYSVDLTARNFAVRHLTGVVHKDVILRLSPGIWAREFPAPQVAGLVDAHDPHRPTLIVRGKTVIASMVSHDPTYAGVVDSLVKENAAVLRSAERLIIDLRGNEGGSSWITNALLPFVRSYSRRKHPYESDSAVMLSSPDQIAYAKRAFGSDTSTFVRELVRRLEAAPGKLSFFPQDDSPARDTLVVNDAPVGVLVDHGTVSAAEVLVLRALESTRATVFGEPTAGALDYQSVNVVRILPDESRWLLGYPTITASPHLPKNGMRGRGIVPHMRMDVTGLWPPIERVERRLSNAQGDR